MFEPEGALHLSQAPDLNRTHGNTAMTYDAFIGSNTFDLHQWHEMEAVVHSQFGTIDNPVLIFTSDSSWRVVICQGPGVEDDSHHHEKMFYFVREGPMHRCHICGQCFKIVRLKDEWSEQMDYYNLMFSQLLQYEVGQDDQMINVNSWWGDRPQKNFQTIPYNQVHIHVNPDDHDHMLVDPAYRMEKYAEAHEKVMAINASYSEIERQLSAYRLKVPMPMGRDIYEQWFKIEMAIRKFDRIYNRVEVFHGRKFNDPDNHDRREKRMVERKRDRWTNHFAFFFGDLTEEEQMYRDYFETDLEQEPEDDLLQEKLDEFEILTSGDFDL